MTNGTCRHSRLPVQCTARIVGASMSPFQHEQPQPGLDPCTRARGRRRPCASRSALPSLTASSRSSVTCAAPGSRQVPARAGVLAGRLRARRHRPHLPVFEPAVDGRRRCGQHARRRRARREPGLEQPCARLRAAPASGGSALCMWGRSRTVGSPRPAPSDQAPRHRLSRTRQHRLPRRKHAPSATPPAQGRSPATTTAVLQAGRAAARACSASSASQHRPQPWPRPSRWRRHAASPASPAASAASRRPACAAAASRQAPASASARSRCRACRRTRMELHKPRAI